MSRVFRKLWIAIVAAMMLFGILPMEAQAKDVAAAVDKGVNWLKEHQKANGSWSDENYPALTALGLWAVSETGREDLREASAKAAAFVASFAQPDGGIYKPATGGRGTGGLSTYNTAICMTVLHKYDAATYAPIILKARDFMVGAQVQGDSSAAGGFGYGRPDESARDRPDLSNTGWSLMAMRSTQGAEDRRPKGEKAADIRWEAALKFVTSLQNQDANDKVNVGGFGYEAGGERGGSVTNREGTAMLRSFGSMTYAGLESMIYAQLDRKDPRVRSAIEWSGQHWNVDENPGMGTRGLFYYYLILAKSLSLLGEGEVLHNSAGKPIAWKTDLAEKLIATQKEDGSWVNPNNMFWEGDSALVTSYAVLVLQFATAK